MDDRLMSGGRVLTVKQGVNALLAIHIAMVEGPAEPGAWTDGLGYVIDHLQKDLEALIASGND